MITFEQAAALSYRDEIHYGLCLETIGKRGGRAQHTETWRVNGRMKTWKTRPGEFSVPIKYGLRQCAYLTNDNAASFHLLSECVRVERHV